VNNVQDKFPFCFSMFGLEIEQLAAGRLKWVPGLF